MSASEKGWAIFAAAVSVVVLFRMVNVSTRIFFCRLLKMVSCKLILSKQVLPLMLILSPHNRLRFGVVVNLFIQFVLNLEP